MPTPFKKRLLIIGLGEAGRRVITDILKKPTPPNAPLGSLKSLRIVGGIDDELAQAKPFLASKSIPYLGSIKALKPLSQKNRFDYALVAIEHCSRELIEKIVRSVDFLRQKVYIIPASKEQLIGNISIDSIRQLQAEDLIGRRPLISNPSALVASPLTASLKGKVVLVTGGGGSIGSELCKQLLAIPVKKVLALSRGEQSLFFLREKLEREVGIDKPIHYIIGDAGDEDTLRGLSAYGKIDVIFHAAAHKHVPLMERQEKEAFKNNCLVTERLLEFAKRTRVAHFVQISTDKAVNPTTIMGKSKRIAEKICYSHASKNSARNPASQNATPPRLTIVRFGNVISSRGSVIPLFKRQIRAGGPITVTDPECYRYFMTIREAAILALEAFVLNDSDSAGLDNRQTGKKSNRNLAPKTLPISTNPPTNPSSLAKTYMLDMGKPIKIDTLVRLMILLEGYTPTTTRSVATEDHQSFVHLLGNPHLPRKMPISYIGLRRGEKLHEELYSSKERTIKTSNANIFEIRQKESLADEQESLASCADLADKDLMHASKVKLRAVRAATMRRKKLADKQKLEKKAQQEFTKQPRTLKRTFRALSRVTFRRGTNETCPLKNFINSRARIYQATADA